LEEEIKEDNSGTSAGQGQTTDLKQPLSDTKNSLNSNDYRLQFGRAARRIKKVSSQIESLHSQKDEEDSGLQDFENARIRRQ
jgi:hypothetical protein